jgi:hypothetical protein
MEATSIARRQRVRLGALGLIGVGGYMLLQQTFGFSGQVGLLAAGVVCLVLSVVRPQLEKLIVPGGLLSGIGLGILLTSDQLPLGIHMAIHIASVALGFGLIYALGSAAYRWAKRPAVGFAVLSGLVLLFGLPGEPMRMWWPILIVAGGLWIMRRELHSWAVNR